MLLMMCPKMGYLMRIGAPSLLKLAVYILGVIFILLYALCHDDDMVDTSDMRRLPATGNEYLVNAASVCRRPIYCTSFFWRCGGRRADVLLRIMRYVRTTTSDA